MYRSVSSTLVLIAALAFSSAAAPQNVDAGPGPQRAVLVTGATSGIGLMITRVLASSGTFVYAGARSADDIARLDAMDNVRALRLDVTVGEDIDAAVDTVREAGRGLYGVVNNAGVATVGALIEQPVSELEFVFDVNVYGPYRITQAFAPLVIEAQGRIVNISSISGILSGNLFGIYSMSKHAVEAYSDSLARELERFGVHVAAVEPGNYSSNIGANMLRRMQARGFDIGESRYAEDLQRILDGFAEYAEPGEYNPEPDEVAAAVQDALFSDTPKAHYMVVPYARQAEFTIRKVIEELVRYNEDQPYSFDRGELIEMIDAELTRSAAGR